jgi:hypothetical protein
MMRLWRIDGNTTLCVEPCPIGAVDGDRVAAANADRINIGYSITRISSCTHSFAIIHRERLFTAKLRRAFFRERRTPFAKVSTLRGLIEQPLDDTVA